MVQYEVVRQDPRSRQIGNLILACGIPTIRWRSRPAGSIDTFRPFAHHAAALPARHRFERVRDYLHDNYMRTVTLDELAQAAALSPYHFQRQFKAHSRHAAPDADGDSPVARQAFLPRIAADVALAARLTDQSHLTRPSLALRHYAGALSKAGSPAPMRNLIQYSRFCLAYTVANEKVMEGVMISGVLYALLAGLMWIDIVGPLLLPDYPAVLQSMGRYLALG